MSFLKPFLKTLTFNTKKEVNDLMSKELIDFPQSYFEKKGCKPSSCHNCKDLNCRIQRGEISGDITNIEFIRHFISQFSDETQNEINSKLSNISLSLKYNNYKLNFLSKLLVEDFHWPSSYPMKRGCKYCNVVSCNNDTCPIKNGKRTADITNRDYFIDFFALIPISVTKEMNRLTNKARN